jgi:hypothetical protein
MRLREDDQIAPLAHRPQKSLGRVPAPSALLIHIEITAAEVVAQIEIRDARNAFLLGRTREIFENIPAQALLFHPPFAARAVEGVGAAIKILAALENRQYLVPGPVFVAGGGGPAVVVLALAAHVDHAVDGRTAAQHAAARIAQRAAVEPGFDGGAIQPVGARVADAMQIAHRNMYPVIVIASARLQQQHARVRIGAQAVGQHAAGRTRAHHDIVERFHNLLARHFVLVRAPLWRSRARLV